MVSKHDNCHGVIDTTYWLWCFIASLPRAAERHIGIADLSQGYRGQKCAPHARSRPCNKVADEEANPAADSEGNLEDERLANQSAERRPAEEPSFLDDASKSQLSAQQGPRNASQANSAKEESEGQAQALATEGQASEQGSDGVEKESSKLESSHTNVSGSLEMGHSELEPKRLEQSFVSGSDPEAANPAAQPAGADGDGNEDRNSMDGESLPYTPLSEAGPDGEAQAPGDKAREAIPEKARAEHPVEDAGLENGESASEGCSDKEVEDDEEEEDSSDAARNLLEDLNMAADSRAESSAPQDVKEPSVARNEVTASEIIMLSDSPARVTLRYRALPHHMN